MSKITKEDVEYVARLAHLELDEAAKERLVHEMGDILQYMDALNELDTDNVEPMMHAMDMTNVFRQDEVLPSMSLEFTQRMAPSFDGQYFLVPTILEAEEP